MQQIGIDFGPVKSKKNMVLQTHRENFHSLATEALTGTSVLGKAVTPATQKEVCEISGTWFNAEEPALFELAWKTGEPTVT